MLGPPPRQTARASRVLELEQNGCDDQLVAFLARRLLQWDAETEPYRTHDPIRLFADQRSSGERRGLLKMGHARLYRWVPATADSLHLEPANQIFQGLEVLDREWVSVQGGRRQRSTNWCAPWLTPTWNSPNGSRF